MPPSTRTTAQWAADVEAATGGEWVATGAYAGSAEQTELAHRCGHVKTMRADSFMRAIREGQQVCLHCAPQVAGGRSGQGPRPPKPRTASTRGQKPKSDEEFRKEVARLGKGRYETLTPYVKNDHKVEFRHLDCGNVFWMRPNSFRRGYRCRPCALASRVLPGKAFTKEQLVERLAAVHGENEYEVLEAYTNNATPTLFRHSRCGKPFRAMPHNLMRSGTAKASSCPHCRGWTDEEFREVFNARFEAEEYEFLTRYAGFNRPIRMQHLVCGHVWEPTPNNLLNSETRCPQCADHYDSKLSRRVRAELERLGLAWVREKKFEGLVGPGSAARPRGQPLRFDYWIEELLLLVEADGELHEVAWNDRFGEENLRRTKLRDAIKNDWAKANSGSGIRLLRVNHRDPDPEGTVRAAVLEILEKKRTDPQDEQDR